MQRDRTRPGIVVALAAMLALLVLASAAPIGASTGSATDIRADASPIAAKRSLGTPIAAEEGVRSLREANGTALTNARVLATPPSPNASSVHRVGAAVGESLANQTVTRMVVDYSHTNVSLAEVETADISAGVLRNPGTENFRSVDLPAAIYSVGKSRITVHAAGNLVLREGDLVSVTVRGVHNPNRTGTEPVTFRVGTHTMNVSTTATLDVRYPAPTLSDQGQIGPIHRIAVHSPRGSGGFLVVTDESGAVVGTHSLSTDQNIRMDIGMRSLVGENVSPQATLTVTAYRDTDGDGTYTHGVDEPWRRDGEPVSLVVENALATTTTTTTTPTSTTTSPDSTTQRTTGLDSTTPGDTTETITTTPGFGFGVVALAVLIVLIVRQ
ncbi:MAG: hypothetical protein ABEJ58_02330 [Halodesulfurarchaeum sp.]